MDFTPRGPRSGKSSKGRRSDLATAEGNGRVVGDGVGEKSGKAPEKQVPCEDSGRESATATGGWVAVDERR